MFFFYLSEVWLLHDNVFYLFWSDNSDCSAALSFCSKRNASLAVLSVYNKVQQLLIHFSLFFCISTLNSFHFADLGEELETDAKNRMENNTLTNNTSSSSGIKTQYLTMPLT